MSSFPICAGSELKATGQGRAAQRKRIGRECYAAYVVFLLFRDSTSTFVQGRHHCDAPFLSYTLSFEGCILSRNYGSRLDFHTLEASMSIKRLAPCQLKPPLKAVGQGRRQTASVVVSGWLLLWHVPCSCSPETRAGKLGEPVAVDIHCERAEAGDQYVKAKIELLAADDVGIGDIALYHVRHGLCRVVPSEE